MPVRSMAVLLQSAMFSTRPTCFVGLSGRVNLFSTGLRPLVSNQDPVHKVFYLASQNGSLRRDLCSRKQFRNTRTKLTAKAVTATEDPQNSNQGIPQKLDNSHLPENVSTISKADEDEDEDDPSLIETFRVFKNEDGERIDKVIAERYGERSRTYVQKLLSGGFVRVNEAEKKSKAFRVSKDDLITVKFLQQEREITLQGEDIPLDVLFEDDEIAIINKPAGMVVHPSPGHWTGTLVHALCHRYPQMLATTEQRERPGIVHRLDKGTSGAIVIARTAQAHMKMSERFAMREIQKEYIAITVGDPCGKTGRQMLDIDVPIGRNSHDRMKMMVDTPATNRSCVKSKEARTSVYTVGHDSRGVLHAVRVQLHTGRTHQIRVHLQHLRSPVLGDDLYGNLEVNRRFITSAPRPMLHAHSLDFVHPIYPDKVIKVSAPIPDDMTKLMTNVVYPSYKQDFPTW